MKRFHLPVEFVVTSSLRYSGWISVPHRMTGKLAGLFVGRPTSHEAALNSKLPAGPSRPASPSEIHEQVRALNDPDTVLRGELHCSHQSYKGD